MDTERKDENDTEYQRVVSDSNRMVLADLGHALPGTVIVDGNHFYIIDTRSQLENGRAYYDVLGQLR